jgi:hypothetical protein
MANTLTIALERKAADPLRVAISSALASSLLADLSAIVVEYARTAYVDWDCETCLDLSLVPGAGKQVWTLSDRSEGPRLTVALPGTGRFVWLCGRRPFSHPAAVRRWSIAVVDSGNWGMYFGVGAVDSKAAVARTQSTEMHPTGGVLIDAPAGLLYDGTAPGEKPPPREISRMRTLNGLLCFALTFEVDVDANTLAVQGIGPAFDSTGRDSPASWAEAVVRVHETGELPTGWKASPVLRTGKLPATADLSRCVPLCGLWGRSDVCEVLAPAQWFPLTE